VYEADRALVVRMRAGDQRAFDEFFNTCTPRLLAFAARRTAMDITQLEDIVQNTLLKAVRKLDSYRGEAALFTWLTQICRNELSDAHRKAARQPEHVSLDESTNLTLAQLRGSESLEPAAALEWSTRRSAIMHILNTMPDQYTRALEAKYGDGLSVEDIALEFGLTLAAAQSLLSRARQAFRTRWRSKYHEPPSEASRYD
jgi:RNA polymerase sigma-70 factor (ECF subfamily)